MTSFFVSTFALFAWVVTFSLQLQEARWSGGWRWINEGSTPERQGCYVGYLILWKNVTLRNELNPNLLSTYCCASSVFLLIFFNPQKDAYAKYSICSFWGDRDEYRGEIVFQKSHNSRVCLDSSPVHINIILCTLPHLWLLFLRYDINVNVMNFSFIWMQIHGKLKVK